MVRRSTRRLVRSGRLIAVSAALAFGGLAASAAQQTPPAPQSSSLPSARQIVDKFVEATGGNVAFKGISSMRARGSFTITGQQMSGELEMVAARPNKLLTRIHVPNIGDLEEGYDGKIGWSIDPFRGPSIVTGRELEERADEAWFDAPLHGVDFVKEMTVIGKEQLEQRDVYRLKVISMRGVEQFELFDALTGLQAGVEAVRETPFGNVPTTTIFKAHQRFGPVTFPSQVVQRILGQEQVLTFSTYEFNTVPPAMFDLPATIKALIK